MLERLAQEQLRCPLVLVLDSLTRHLPYRTEIAFG